MANQIRCRCGCANPATFTSNGCSFATRPCRQRFYRHTVRAARNGDAAAQAFVTSQGWNVYANIGGGAAKSKATPAPQTPAPASPAPQTAPKVRVPRASRIPKICSEFLATRCKSLKLAAKVLGISPKPPLAKSAVRSAWISSISIHHPDRGGSLEAAQAVNAAYQLLQKFSY